MELITFKLNSVCIDPRANKHSELDSHGTPKLFGQSATFWAMTVRVGLQFDCNQSCSLSLKCVALNSVKIAEELAARDANGLSDHDRSSSQTKCKQRKYSSTSDR